jgi:hypothetical protein
MAFTTAGLANGGVTTHYRFHDDSPQKSPTNPNGPDRPAPIWSSPRSSTMAAG